MNFILKQILPDSSHERPIEIHVTEAEVPVGRRSKAVLAKFPQISRDHAIFYKSDDGVLLVKDLKSLNGIYVNEVKISSMKSLKIGDYIGFGVTTDQIDNGFVCVVSSDNPCYKVKPEIIELSDSDDDDDKVPQINSKSVLNSATCHIPIDVQESKNPNSNAQSVSKDFSSKTISTKCEEVIVDNSPNENAPPAKNIAFNNSRNVKENFSQLTSNNKVDPVCPPFKNFSKFSTSSLLNDNTLKNFLENANIPSTSDLQNKNIVPQLNNSLKSFAQSKISEFESSSSSNVAFIDSYVASTSKAVSTTELERPLSSTYVKSFVASIQDFIKNAENITISYKDSNIEEVSPETSKIKCTTNAASDFCNDISIQPPNKTAKCKRTKPYFLKKCSIPLIRCDSEHFKWPADVQNPFTKSNKPSFAQKHNKQISETSDKKLNAYFHKNASNMRDWKDGNIECKKNNKGAEQLNSHKRKYPFSSNVESMSGHSSTTKKHCLENDHVKSMFSSDNKKNQPQITKDSESDSEGEMNYSQVEDVIYISDDDEYLDFKSSKNYIHIKTEPPELDNLEEINCIANLDTNDDFEGLMSYNEMDNLANINQEDNEHVETIESIKAFVGNIEQAISRPVNNNSNNASVISQLNNSIPPQNINSDVENDESNSEVEDCPVLKSSNISSNVSVQKPSKPDSMNETKNKRVKNNFHLNKNGKSKSKIQLIEAQPLEYRPRKMRGRDERVVDKNKSKTPSSTKKKKDESPRKELLAKLADNAKLKNFKIPRKQNRESDSHSKNTDNDQSSSLAVASKNKPDLPKKSPTVKTRPYKSTSRMGFLVHDVHVNPQKNIKPIAVVEGHRKANITVNKSNPNLSADYRPSLSVDRSNLSTVLPSKAAHTQHIPEILNKNVPTLPVSNAINPRDPRQQKQRIAHSSAEVHRQDTSIKRASLATEQNAWLKSVPSNSAYIQGTLVASRSKTIEKSIPHIMQNNINNSKVLERSVSCPNQSNTNNKIFERAIQTRMQNISENVDLRFKLIKDLLYLNTKWLQEQIRMKLPPPAVSAGATDLPLKYDSYDSYVSSFYPMLMLEIWEQMYTESKEVYASEKQYNKFFFSVLSYTSKVDLIELKCESVVNEKVCFSPCEGSLAILELKESSRKCSPVFGYIFKYKNEPLNLNNLKLSHWKNLPKQWITNAKHWTFYVHIKKREMSFALDTLMKGNGLCYIRNKLRLVDALSYLKNCPLLTDILQPKWKTFFVKYSAMAPTREFNSGQMEVIECVTSEIIKSKREPKIILLQGPPGTGKTRTIIGLIKKFLTSRNFNSHYKILVTAPSNAAIDEIGCRLIELNRKFKSKETIKFVRVGILEQIHSKMKPYTLDRQANLSYSDFKQLEYLTSEINKLKKEASNSERLKSLEERYKYLTDESFIQRNGRIDINLKQDVLKDCHIILSTLSGCGLSVLLRTFKPNSSMQFSHCIVDESTQCTELEILQPLMLGVKKLILVGDHKQLPATVLSKVACKHGFERSAFERFHIYFETYCKRTPMFTLSEQFRMHSGICEFPSKFIYNQQLITNPNVDVEYSNFPLIPYMVLDIYISQEENDSSSKVNNTEAQVIINICTILLECVHVSPSSIGIITPYQAQRLLYLKSLYVNPLYRDIEVNTVDSFQGREKDIIIISTVRANSQSGGIGFLACKRRLNVAITRARKCLIVCVHGDSLANYHGWKEMIADAKERQVCFAVTSPKDIPDLYKDDMQKKKSGVSNYV